MADIFLSYAREDWERIRPLAQSLEARGWSVWWDTRMRAGRRFDEMIEGELAAAPCVVVAWTERSVRSQWVRAEASEALDQDKLIPVFLDPVKPPLQFRHVQGLDLKGWGGSPDHPVFLRLLEDASLLAGSPPQPDVQSAPRSPDVTRWPPPPEAFGAPAAKARAPEVPEPEMVRIEPGTFLMGSAEGEGYDNERPRHEVRLFRPFAIGRYPITFEEYDAFAGATKRHQPGDFRWGRGRRPVIDVRWEDAVAYAQWLSETTGKRYRLPTEAEWEYAARAGTQTRWSFGDNEGELGRYAWYSESPGGQTHPVGEKEPNPWGLYDVHGNVCEWVQDCWQDDYHGAPNDGSAWLKAGYRDARRVVRGGGWNGNPDWLRSAFRYRLAAGEANYDLGFRLARDL